MIHLKALERSSKPFPDEFPFNVPVIQSLARIEFTTDVTFFVGENGSGKSTLLEAIACAARVPTIGAENVEQDATLAAMRCLADALRWEWTKKTRRGFFMRSEDFFGFAKRIGQIERDLAEERHDVKTSFAGRSELAANLASMPFDKELTAIREQYGDGLDAQSHGESYFKLFRARFVPNGLYLLDEPESPLSPMRQLTLIALMSDMIKLGAQFVIATHSPILLAYPDAAILSFDKGTIQPESYENLEHVTLTRAFLNDPKSFLRHLLD